MRSVIVDAVRDILQDPIDGTAIKEAMAERLMELVKEDYLRKADGQLGVDGTKWESVAKDGRIMVDTGRLLDSLEIVDDGDGHIRLHFGIFPVTQKEDTGRLIALQKRPAWPDEFPRAWLEELRDIVAHGIKDGLAARLNAQVH